MPATCPPACGATTGPRCARPSGACTGPAPRLPRCSAATWTAPCGPANAPPPRSTGRCERRTVPRIRQLAGRQRKLLDVVGLGRPRERPRQAELLQNRLGDALDAGRVGRFTLGVGIIREAADLDRMLGGAVAG